jgi:3-isopropylmalate/(R)-2-methylmalate dehydratase large subunit
LWDEHVVREEDDDNCLIYIDRHIIHEVTSPQAFEGLRLAGRRPWRASSIVATPDHNVPTTDRSRGIEDPVSRLQLATLDASCEEFGIVEFKMDDHRQGIVHVIGPEQGAGERNGTAIGAPGKHSGGDLRAAPAGEPGHDGARPRQ